MTTQTPTPAHAQTPAPTPTATRTRQLRPARHARLPRRSRGWAALVLLPALLLLPACGEAPTLDAPEVHWGQDTCTVCSMILSESRYAAAVVTIRDGEGHTFYFDDVGEMLAWTVPPADQSRRWVRDFETDVWVDAEDATFVKSAQLHTPMGTGIVAVGDAERARAIAQENDGSVIALKDFSPEG